MWELLIAAHLAGTTVYIIFLRKSVLKNVDTWALTALLHTAVTLPFVAKALVLPPELPAYSGGDFLILLATIALLVLAQLFQIKALQDLEVSFGAVVFNTRIFFATILCAALAIEPLQPEHMLGGLFIFIAVVIVRQKAQASITKRGLFYGILTALSLSLLNVFEKILITNVGYEHYALPAFTTCSIVLWIIVLIRRAHIPRSFLFHPYTWLMAVGRSMSGIGFSAALIFGNATATIYLASLSVILIIIFGIIFLGERDHLRRKALAAVFAIIGASFVLLN